MQVGVVAVAEKRLGVGGQDPGVNVPEDFYSSSPPILVSTALISGSPQCPVQVRRPLCWGSLRRPGRGVLDRPQSELVSQPRARPSSNGSGKAPRAAPRRGEYGNRVTPLGLGRVGERPSHRLLHSRKALISVSGVASSTKAPIARRVNALQRLADEQDLSLEGASAGRLGPGPPSCGTGEGRFPSSS